MARQVRSTKEKSQADLHQRTLRRNQVIFSIFAGLLILSMVLSLIRF